MIVIVPPEQAQDVCERLQALGQQAYIVGEILAREDDQPQVELV
jgi:phosphoribosylaminoimidazole (AIR) synthetase